MFFLKVAFKYGYKKNTLFIIDTYGLFFVQFFNRLEKV